MNKTVLISGGSGLIGKQLYRTLAKAGYSPLVLSRNEKLASRSDFIHWDPDKEQINLDAPLEVSGVINLAGANIFAAKWTDERKAMLTSSRLQPIAFLDKLICDGRIRTADFVSTSASGIYGDRKEEWCLETDLPAQENFITSLCRQWESAVADMKAPVSRTILRLGIVVAAEGGILDQYKPLLPLHMAPSFNKGKPYLPWVDIRDVARAFLFALEHESDDTFNVSADPVTIKAFGRKILEAYSSWGFVRNIPNFVIDLVLGERSMLLKDSQRMSNQKLKESGFRYEHTDLLTSLKDAK